MGKPVLALGLHGKYVLTMALLLTTFGATATIINIQTQRAVFRQRVVDKAASIASVLAATAPDLLAGFEIERLRLALSDTRQQDEVIDAYFFDAEGRILTDGTKENHRRDGRPADPLGLKAVAASSTLIQFGPDIVNITEPVFLGGQKVGGVRVGLSLTRMQGEIDALYRRNLSIGVAFVLLGSVAAWVVARSVTGPIARLVEGTRAVARGQYDRKVAIGTGDEVATLAECFNQMTDELKRAEEIQSRQARELTRSNAELKEKNAELESFVYIVSHDLKAPLVTLQGMSSILLQDHRDQLGPEGQHFLERIQANTVQMERLIMDLLALSRIGREARAPEAVDMVEVTDEVLLALAESIHQRGIRATVGRLGSVWAIRTQVEQLMANLVSNAVKYIGNTDSPTVEIGRVDRDGEAEFYVRDNGIGIDRAYHGRIFEVFQCLKEVEAEGTGVGLAIVKKIVDGAGGRVWVESAKGEGATIRFTWPTAQAGETCSAPDLPPPGPFQRRLVTQ